MRWLDGIITQWTSVWANSRRWWRTGKPGSPWGCRGRHNWATEQQQLGLYILITALNINGLNAPIKRDRLSDLMNIHACMHFHLPHHSAWLPKFYLIILYCYINYVLIIACKCKFFWGSGYWLWKLVNIFY